MQATPEHHARIAALTFASVYPFYVSKVTSKGRTEDELHAVIEWLTGYTVSQIEHHIHNKSTFKDFFEQATLNAGAHLITGVICGYRIEEIDNHLTKQARYLDKMVDELAKGRPLSKILRT